MRRTVDARLLAALRLAGSDGAYALDLMDATGVRSGSLYPALYRLHEAGLIVTEKQAGGRSRVWLTAAAAAGTSQ